jgi:hypothetical protein
LILQTAVLDTWALDGYNKDIFAEFLSPLYQECPMLNKSDSAKAVKRLFRGFPVVCLDTKPTEK